MLFFRQLRLTVADLARRVGTLEQESRTMGATQETEQQAVAKLTTALQLLKTDVSNKLVSLVSQLQQALASQDFSNIDAITADVQAFQQQLDAGQIGSGSSGTGGGASSPVGGS
jgi:hypothetical protein